MITLKNTLPHATATWTNWHFQTWVVMVLWDCDARWGAEHACLGTWGTDFSPGHSASFVKLSQTPPDVTIPSLHCIQFNIWGFFICLSLHWIQNALWSLRQLNTCLLKDPFGQSEVGDWKLGWARLYFSASANLYFSRLVSCTWILLERAVQNNLTSTFFFFERKIPLSWHVTSEAYWEVTNVYSKQAGSLMIASNMHSAVIGYLSLLATIYSCKDCISFCQWGEELTFIRQCSWFNTLVAAWFVGERKIAK